MRQRLKKSTKCNTNKISEKKICDIVALQEELKSTRKEMKKIMKESELLRIQHIRNMAEEQIRLNPTKIYENEMKILLHVEEQRKLAKAMKLVYKTQRKRGLHHILIPAEESCEDDEKDSNFDHLSMDTIWKKVNDGNLRNIQSWVLI